MTALCRLVCDETAIQVFLECILRVEELWDPGVPGAWGSQSCGRCLGTVINSVDGVVALSFDMNSWNME